MLLSIPFLYFFGAALGLLLLGCWQLISALLNTYFFIDSGYKKPIFLYWIFCIADLGLISLLLLFENNLTSDQMMIILWVTLGGAVFIAGYYLRIYYRLIEFISLRNELDGLTKSKH
jgi:hypothetical protein